MNNEHDITANSLWGRLSIGGASNSPLQTINSLTFVPEAGVGDTFVEASPSIEEFELASFLSQIPKLSKSEGGDLEYKRMLGEGGMGQVDLVSQSSLFRDVAVKRVSPNKVSNKTTALLLHESFVAGALEHPNMIPVHMLGRTEDGQPALVMRRVEGVSWEVLLQEPNHPLWKRRQTWSDDLLVGHIEILIELCNALEFAHSRGFIHRDLKPENVMIGAFGEVYLLDWGLAAPSNAAEAGLSGGRTNSFSTPASLGGTPSYMAPEMMLGDLSLLDARTDVFLLGATLHRVLTGRSRHSGETIAEALMSVATCLPYPYGKEIPAELGNIANRATNRDPNLRFQNARSFREALSSYLRHLSSNKLCQTAEQKLLQLSKLVDSQSIATHGLSQIIRRLFNECRFGFLQALEAWPKNPTAKNKLEEVLSVMINFEIKHEHLDHALTLFAELKNPSVEISERLQVLHQQQKQDEDEHTRIKQIAFEQDFSIGLNKRIKLMAILGLCIGSLSIGLLVCVRTELLQLTYTKLIGSIAVAFVILGGIIWRWRETLLSNVISRKFLSFVAICMISMLFSRIGGSVMGFPLSFMLLFEFLLFAVVLSAASLVFLPALIWGFPVCLGAFLMGLIWPSIIYELFTFLTFFMWFFPVYTFGASQQTRA